LARTQRLQGCETDQVPDVGDDPRCAGLDELIVVLRIEAGVDHLCLRGDDADQGPQRAPALSLVADPQVGREQFVERVGVD
jgi:hypothetical protein